MESNSNTNSNMPSQFSSDESAKKKAEQQRIQAEQVAAEKAVFNSGVPNEDYEFAEADDSDLMDNRATAANELRTDECLFPQEESTFTFNSANCRGVTEQKETPITVESFIDDETEVRHSKVKQVF